MPATALGDPPQQPGSGQDPADRQRFAALAARHAEHLRRVAFHLLKHPQDAEDCVQETLMKLYRNGGWQAAQDERAFLASAVWRVGLNRLGSAGARAMRHAADVATLPLVSPGRTPEQAAEAGEQHALVRELIDALPDTLRQPLLLSAIEGMRSVEVATILGIPEGTVRTRVMRARAEVCRRFEAATRPPLAFRKAAGGGARA